MRNVASLNTGGLVLPTFNGGDLLASLGGKMGVQFTLESIKDILEMDPSLQFYTLRVLARVSRVHLNFRPDSSLS